MPIPDSIINAPELDHGLSYYISVFNALTGSRPSSDGFVARIPYQTISLYCKDNGIWGEEREDLFHHVNALDVCFVTHMFEEMEKKVKAASKTPPGNKTKAK